MASFIYLWSNRKKHPLFSINYLKSWAKRIITFPELLKRNARRWSLNRKGASIANSAEIGLALFEGSKKNLLVGHNSFIGRARFALHDRIEIGDSVCINDGAIILTASHDVSDPEWRLVSKKIVIEDYVWIGTNAMILPGVQLGKGCVVGAGSVVSKSVPAGNIVAGNPAKPLNKMRTDSFNYTPCEFLAANNAWLKG